MSRDRVECQPVPASPATPDPKAYKPTNRINLSLSYDKSRKLVYLSVYPCHVGDGMMSTMLMSGKLVRIEGMARLNYNRLEVLAAGVDAQIEAREGAAWGVVLDVAEKEGLTLETLSTSPMLTLNDDNHIEPFDLGV